MGLVLSAPEDDGYHVAADRLFQLLCQGGEMTRLHGGEETNHQQSEERGERGKLKKMSSEERLDAEQREESVIVG